MADLVGLAERVERYAPSGHYDLDRENERALNEAIGLAIGVGHRIKVGDPALGNDRWVPTPLKPYVTSLDAAMTLVPEGCAPGVYQRDNDEWASMIFGPDWQPIGDTRARTAALALAAAALRARATTEGGSHG